MILATDFLMVQDDQFTRFSIGSRIYFAVPVTLDETEKISRLQGFVNAYNLGLMDGYQQGSTEQVEKMRHALMLPSIKVLNNF